MKSVTLPPPAPQPATRRGEIQVEIGGQLRTLKFGMNTTIAFGQLHADGPLDFSHLFATNPLLGLRDMTYCGLLMRRADNELPTDFSPELVGDWIEDMEQDEWNRVQACMTSNLTPGKKQPDPTATATAKATPPTPAPAL